MLNKKILIILFGLFLLIFSAPNIDAASSVWQAPDIQIKFFEFSDAKCNDNGDGTKDCDVPWIYEYIVALYKYAVGIVGIVAVVVMMWGGVVWMTSFGNSSRVGEAKSWIAAALTGLVLVMCSYTILYYINPKIIENKYIKISTVNLIEVGNESIEEAGTSQAMPFFDCVHKTYGTTKEQTETHLVSGSFLGHTYRVNYDTSLALVKAQNQINAQGLTYKCTHGTFGSGYNWRANVNKPTEQSLHSFGLAIDICPDNNPNVKPHPAGSCETDIPVGIINALKSNGFRWGGDYKSVCDSMHFEYVKGDAPCTI